MRKLIILMIFSFIFAFDFFTIKKADEYFKNKQYLQAAKEYLKINSQKALLNAANSFYKAGKYKKAIEINPKYIEAKFNLSLLYLRNSQKPALRT